MEKQIQRIDTTPQDEHETDPFGPEPTETIVGTRFGDPMGHGYSERGRWGRRLDGRPVRLGGVQGDPVK